MYQLQGEIMQLFRAGHGGARPHPKVLPTIASRLVHACARVDRLDLAELVVGQLINDVQAFAAEQGTEIAAEMVGPAPFNALLQAYCRAGDAGKARMVLEEMQAVNVKPNGRTYMTLIKACGPQDVDHALNIFGAMLSTENMRVSKATFNKVLDICFAAGSSHREQTGKVFDHLLARYPVKPGCRAGPNATTLSLLISQCSSEADLDSVMKDAKAWCLWQAPLVQADVMRACLRIAGGEGQEEAGLAMCLDWANRYDRRGASLSVEAAAVVLDAYAATGALSGATSFVHETRTKTGLIDEGALRRFVKSIARRNDVAAIDPRSYQTVRRLWSDIGQRAPLPSWRTVLALIEAMGRVGDLQALQYLYTLVSNPAAAPTLDPAAIPLSGLHIDTLLVGRLHPQDPRLLRSLLFAFSTRLAVDPPSALSIARSAPASEPLALALFRTVRSRTDALPLLDAIITLAIVRGTPLRAPRLARALSRVIVRAAVPGHPPMAFSPAAELRRLGPWGRRVGVLSPAAIDTVQGAVVRAVARGVASAASDIREARDVENALAALEGWVNGVEPRARDVEAAVGMLNHWVETR
ncbi:hypothetical protein BDK51DRAFT_25692 [Blyttiomyces helicus]|uniref:Pentacotripeptide-repeat region of PRORP domain-containing protein n=1 Tax=Blyttiomyces helicus TaxID=388810 RepID=A0A4P9WJD4_9FUNG|nr:hypothetical protein BDK51DRAFT_25692 [Blyttiomyces helicus]|eukprot:RKO92944.1 hypothetical protein BDK51DRAFT_25692 [Blyttiomyces helicus]